MRFSKARSPAAVNEGRGWTHASAAHQLAEWNQGDLVKHSTEHDEAVIFDTPNRERHRGHIKIQTMGSGVMLRLRPAS